MPLPNRQQSTHFVEVFTTSYGVDNDKVPVSINLLQRWLQQTKQVNQRTLQVWKIKFKYKIIAAESMS